MRRAALPVQNVCNGVNNAGKMNAVYEPEYFTRKDGMLGDILRLLEPLGRRGGSKDGLAVRMRRAIRSRSSSSTSLRSLHRCSPLTETGPGAAQEKEKVLLSEIITRVNDLFEGDLTDDDRLIYVNNVLKGKLLESETLREQATNNSKEQFAASPDLSNELLSAIMDALGAHISMSNQALNSERVREGIKDVLLGPAGLYEALRERVAASADD
jgi:type I restriction enzyme, R subunit